MGIIKIRCWTPEMSAHSKRSSTSTADELEQGERIISGSYLGDDSDNCEFTEAGCEFCMVGDQLCSIPYELYDLPDLKEILSLETWNSCLTEEERFSLSAYLPDMDQHMFWLTMKELLSGKNMFFGSPLMELFKRLKGGLYPLKVTRFREGLQFLQRRAFYHSVRSYHENLARTFSEMKRAWRKCQPSIGVEERVRIWNTWKNHKANDMVDLNALPTEDDTSTDDSETVAGPVVKKMKIPPVVSGMSLVRPSTNAKGVLKIKQGGLNYMQTGMVCRPPPKGVLKIIPRGPLTQPQLRREIPTRQELTTLRDISGLPQPTCRSPLPQSMVQWDSENYHVEAPFLHQTVGGRKAYRSSELPESIVGRRKVEYLNNTTEPSKNFQSSIRMLKRVKDPMFDTSTKVEEHNTFPKNPQSIRRHTRENIQIGKHLTSENLWQNLGPQNVNYYHHDSGERQMTPMYEKQIPMHSRTTEVSSGISDIGTGGHQMLPAASLDLSTGRHRDSNDECLQKPYEKSAASKVGLRDGAMLPITYKRRKAQTKPEPVSGLVKPLTAGVDFESRTLNEKNHHLGENAMTVKIKFKNRKDRTPLHNQGVLNWLPHSSPSG
ncbi:uncharacterized protein LOC131257664 [Magnolia sinica]|uniref:uncharacterized protein LOC131257664 n=1 Tax=Magnolia sinica TaxID=86752 RepID=UPI002657E829|nr:uncharacterized protein LOC131257664 [Magnolia sinica]XP_058114425.1 uncharacterized protein LOC131257664 [Magnolia sinica]XP_058114426.1 uncharacterized protein LOC131257664 [Magnolia sinica]XP_058114427.1 uncharacterized protein LOC131257664 [Magnolia sinica]XP_058114428.1 uncharacterized protein LOC131257664 [Magnolia sinica]XP_058114429.1 uncharacterized protein LOC131257664 [Magnolia sinica]